MITKPLNYKLFINYHNELLKINLKGFASWLKDSPLIKEAAVVPIRMIDS